MTRENEKYSKLPEWYNLENYNSAKDLSLLDWAMNLTLRKRIFELMHGDFGVFYPVKFNELDNEEVFTKINEFSGSKKIWFEENIALIKDFGVIPRSHLQSMYELFKDVYGLREMDAGLGIVFPMTIHDAVSVYNTIQSATLLRNKLALVDYHGILDSDRETPLHKGEEKLHDWVFSHYFKAAYDDEFSDNDYLPYIRIDLSTTDEDIMEAISSWLQARRKRDGLHNSSPTKRLSSSLTKKWIDSGILSYIDLKIYERLEGVSLPLHVIGDAVFSKTKEIDTAEAVRKTTRQHAEKALTQARTILRHALIAEERDRKA